MRRGLTSRLSLWRGDRVVALALIGRRPLLAGQFALTSIFQPRLLHKRPMSGKCGGLLRLWQCQPHHFPRPTGASVRFCNLHRCISGSSLAPRIFLAAKRHASPRIFSCFRLRGAGASRGRSCIIVTGLCNGRNRQSVKALDGQTPTHPRQTR